MKIILDAFGGDHAPLEPLKGAAWAVKELGVEVLAVGDIAKMEACCKENNIDLTGIDDKSIPLSFAVAYPIGVVAVILAFMI